MTTLTAGGAVELDIALPVRRSFPPPPVVGAIEVDVARPFLRSHLRAVGQAVEIDAAQSLSLPLNPPESGGAFTVSALATRYYFIGDVIPFTTNAVPGAASYEWQFEHQQNHTTETRLTPTPAVTWSPSKAGHYLAKVRAAPTDPWKSTADSGYSIFAWLRPPSF